MKVRLFLALLMFCATVPGAETNQSAGCILTGRFSSSAGW